VGRPSKYPAEFREQAVELVPSGRTIAAEVARDLGVSDTALGYWMKTDRAQRGVPEANGQVALTSDVRAEMARLRRENATLREEREILTEAAFNA
jgi:transposase